MISVEHYVACQEAFAPLFPKIQLGCNLADFRMEALTLLERAGIQQKDMLSHWENMEPLVDYHAALSAVQRMELGTQEGVIDQWPAWELVRFSDCEPRRTDWDARWRAAGEAVNWEGACRERMVALKTSPIWQALGDGAGGFDDALGNPFPPFAIFSHYDWEDVGADEAEALGLDLPTATELTEADQEIIKAMRKMGLRPEDFDDLSVSVANIAPPAKEP